MTTGRKRTLFHKETEGLRVTAKPRYIADQSRPAMAHYVFAYRIRLENVGTEACRLLSRRWLIHDAVGEDTEVEGDGVVGEQPHLEPGAVYEYQSFCVLKGGRGWMEGTYRFERPDGSEFDAVIPRFELNAGGVSALD